jgi:hypothetical protein
MPCTNDCAEATREEMSAARLPLPYRDSCAHLLIPLNRCRYEEFYLPWKCEVRKTWHEGTETTGTLTGLDRTSAIHTRSANTRSSRSG